MPFRLYYLYSHIVFQLRGYKGISVPFWIQYHRQFSKMNLVGKEGAWRKTLEHELSKRSFFNLQARGNCFLNLREFSLWFPTCIEKY